MDIKGNTEMQKKSLWTSLWIATLTILSFTSLYAAPIGLQNATSTESERDDYTVSETIDGLLNEGDIRAGWSPDTQTTTSPAIAVWETVEDILGPSHLTFTMHYLFDFDPQHLPKRIRLSVTSDDRSEFADGLQNNGDVSANWVELTDLTFSGPDGLTFTHQGDNSYSLGGTIPDTAVITVDAISTISHITGIRFEALPDGESGTNGFGNGYDFVFTEIELDASAAPISAPQLSILWLMGLAYIIATGRRRKT